MTTEQYADELFARVASKLPARRVARDTLSVNGRCMINRRIHADYLNLLVGEETPPGYCGSFGAQLFDFRIDWTTVDMAEHEIMPWVLSYSGLNRH